jgi:uncharacterized protein (DUF1697 family)
MRCSMEKIGYIVLLRGINVGGKNIIKMEALKKLFEGLKFYDVKTYIQSGNIIFYDYEKDKPKLKENIEKALYTNLNTKINIAVLTYTEIKEIVNKKPNGFGENDRKKYDVIYLIEPLKINNLVKEVKTRVGIDEMYKGEKVLYISREKDFLSKSCFSKLNETPIYQNITIRNWNTTKKLFELMESNNG